jgi:hypothetical protein
MLGVSQWLGFPARWCPARDLAGLFQSLPRRHLCGCRSVVVGGCFASCASWVVDLWVLRPPRRPRAALEDSPSWSGSSPLSALLRVATTRRPSARGHWCFWFLGARFAAYGTSPPQTRPSDGFSGIFCFFRWSFRVFSRRSGGGCFHTPVRVVHAPSFFFLFSFFL